MAQMGFESRFTDFNQITILFHAASVTPPITTDASPLKSIIIFDITLFITFCNINLGRLFSLLQTLVTSSESQYCLTFLLSKHFQLKNNKVSYKSGAYTLLPEQCLLNFSTS